MGFLTPPADDPEWTEQNRTHIVHLAALQLHVETEDFFTFEQLFQQAKEFSCDPHFRREFLTPERLAEADIRMLHPGMYTIR